MQLRGKASAAAVFTSVYIGSNPDGQYFCPLPIAQFTFAASTPVFALYSPGAPAVIKQTNVDAAGNWTVLVLCCFVGQTVEVLCFDTAQAQGGTFGLQIFREDSVCIFDASQPPLLITDFKSGNIAGVDPNANTHNGTTTFADNTIFPTTPGRKYAVVGAMGPVLGEFAGTVGNGQLNTFLFPACFQMDDGQIQMLICGFGETPAAVQGSPNYSTAPVTGSHRLTAYGSCYSYQFLIADVTGIV